MSKKIEVEEDVSSILRRDGSESCGRSERHFIFGGVMG
jgi:hypothetical protein